MTDTTIHKAFQRPYHLRLQIPDSKAIVSADETEEPHPRSPGYGGPRMGEAPHLVVHEPHPKSPVYGSLVRGKEGPGFEGGATSGQCECQIEDVDGLCEYR
ncbi:hypothetical protein LTR09_007563 [Extremus antarcticus]|uniref:Uncharacterized protein n=1 Tax=Extremus antarcticus TaxID=702011 RepID=A0AAJ0DC69_9PEZI|nr:hypothetical protein LTR09_007563 [Extremus antarcticus]